MMVFDVCIDSFRGHTGSETSFGDLRFSESYLPLT